MTGRGGRHTVETETNRERDRERERREEQREVEGSLVRPVRHHKNCRPVSGKIVAAGRNRDQPHGVASPVKEKRREYLIKVEPYMFGEAERGYNSLCRRYSKLFVVPEFAKLLVLWTEKESQIRLDQPISPVFGSALIGRASVSTSL
ncbi:hypothetical protein R1flu_025806 [Riccia fluitans]|uniref:Maturase K n=1 Tax=Riccia fluitans TaxID=41844 RepID=A0ABD1XZ81_9MARC